MNLLVAAATLGAIIACLPTAPKPLSSGPIAYYDGACAHCHGQNGSAYSEDFFKKYDTAVLTKSIKEMAEGPGQSPLDADGLKAQVAYHQAIIAHLPFIAWTGRDGGKLNGEVTRKATLVASFNRERLTVVVKGTRWSLELPADAKLGGLVLTATLSGKCATWKPGTDAFSKPATWPPKPVN